MAKKYNLGSSSDMKRFQRDITNAAENMVRKAANDMEIEVECPNCHTRISAHSGMNFCPVCRQQIDVDLDIHF